MSASADVNGLIQTITVVLVPVIGSTVLAIVNFIQHHTHNARTIELTGRVAAVEAQAMAIDKNVQDNKANIATAVDVATTSSPALSTAIVKHETQLTLLEQKMTDIATQLQKLQSAVPTT